MFGDTTDICMKLYQSLVNFSVLLVDQRVLVTTLFRNTPTVCSRSVTSNIKLLFAFNGRQNILK